MPIRQFDECSSVDGSAPGRHGQAARLRDLRDRLETRRPEIVEALLTRVYGVAHPGEVGDIAYLEGFSLAAVAAVDFALGVIDGPEERPPMIPEILTAQGRLAARHGVRLDTVLRRYTAGQAILLDFLIEEVQREPTISPAELRRLLASSSSAFDRLLLSVGDVYADEADRCPRTASERSKLDRVERLLAGELISSDLLDYPLDGWHIGLVIEGTDVRDAIGDLARQLDRRLLSVEPHPGTVWAWLGGRTRVDSREVAKRVRRRPLDMKLALGEPCRGVAGWRLSHSQARAVIPLAKGQPVALAHYATVGVLASIQKDQVLVDSLRTLYLEPLSGGDSHDEVLAETLRAYFAAQFSTSSAASALQVHRQTVTSRLRAVEERLGRSISDCALELNLGLLLAETNAADR